MDELWLAHAIPGKNRSLHKVNSLIAILQQNRKKVCSVMDYQELNQHLDVFMANVDV